MVREKTFTPGHGKLSTKIPALDYHILYNYGCVLVAVRQQAVAEHRHTINGGQKSSFLTLL